MFEQQLVKEMMVPYMLRSEISIKIVNEVNYEWLLSQYEPNLKKTIQTLNPELLGTSVYLFEAFMSPEHLRWK